MTEEKQTMAEEWVSLNEAAALVGRTAEALRMDSKSRGGQKPLLELTKRTGIRGAYVRLDRFNLYIKRKHGTRCKPITPESLAIWRASRQ